jgi:hypothetical protein
MFMSADSNMATSPLQTRLGVYSTNGAARLVKEALVRLAVDRDHQFAVPRRVLGDHGYLVRLPGADRAVVLVAVRQPAVLPALKGVAELEATRNLRARAARVSERAVLHRSRCEL